MQKLIEILNDRGFQVDEEILRQWVERKGKNPEKLANGDVAQLAREYAEESKGAIAPVQNSSNKPAVSGKGGGLNKKDQTLNPQQSTSAAKRRSLAQVESMLQGLEETISDDNTAVAQHMLHIIDGNTRAADILQKFAAEAQGQEDNLDFFRDLGSSIGRQFAIATGTSEAE